MLARHLCVAAVIVATSLASTSAEADVAINLKAKDPVAGLPAVSADGLNFLRPFRVWRKACKKPDITVEFGPIDPTNEEPEYSQVPLVGGCEAPNAYASNVEVVNESMRDTQCATVPVRGKKAMPLPGSLEAEDLHVDITVTATTVHILVNKLEQTVGAWTGGRRVELLGKPTAIHGWYLAGEEPDRQLALLLTSKGADGTITEQWVEIWLQQVAKKPTPEDTARTWLLALAEANTEILTAVTAAPFERAGFEPVGEEAEACAELRVAKKADQLEAVLGCALVEGPKRYTMLFDGQEFSTIKASKIPAVLKAHKSKITKLSKKGHKLVLFHIEQDGWNVSIVLAIKGGKVGGVFESAKPES